jgi:hypothetical protein
MMISGVVIEGGFEDDQWGGAPSWWNPTGGEEEVGG